jgi:hypothetical protein
MFDERLVGYLVILHELVTLNEIATRPAESDWQQGVPKMKKETGAEER